MQITLACCNSLFPIEFSYLIYTVQVCFEKTLEAGKNSWPCKAKKKKQPTSEPLNVYIPVRRLTVRGCGPLAGIGWRVHDTYSCPSPSSPWGRKTYWELCLVDVAHHQARSASSSAPSTRTTLWMRRLSVTGSTMHQVVIQEVGQTGIDLLSIFWLLGAGTYVYWCKGLKWIWRREK